MEGEPEATIRPPPHRDPDGPGDVSVSSGPTRSYKGYFNQHPASLQTTPPGHFAAGRQDTGRESLQLQESCRSTAVTA